MSEFVGASRLGLVEGLVGLYDQCLAGQQPFWVSLEAESGWGKTRVAREFYGQLAVRQEKPYWPAQIDDHGRGRKAAYPAKFTSPPEALPEFFWWGISCSTRPGVPGRALREDLVQLKKHEPQLERVSRELRKLESLRTRTARAGRTIANLSAREFITEAIALVVGPAAPVAGLAVAGAMTAWDKARQRRDWRQEFASAFDFDIDQQPDVVEEIVDQLGRYTKSGFPVVIFVEDAHGADGLLWKLLDEALDCGGCLFVITTAWPAGLHAGSQFARVAAKHEQQRRLLRVADSGPVEHEAFPSGAGLTELEEEARTKILAAYYPRVEEATRRALLSIYRDPWSLELFCGIGKYRREDKYRTSEGALYLSPDVELPKVPKEKEDLYRSLWLELSDEIKFALAVAHVMTPASINSGVAAGEDRWTDTVLHDVISNLGILNHKEILSALCRAPSAYAWVRIVDDHLRAFAEALQRDIANSDGLKSLNQEFGDARQHVLTTLARTLLDDSDANKPQSASVARSILALHAEGFVSDHAVTARAIATLLVDLADNPLELAERAGLYRRFTHLDPKEILDDVALVIRHHGVHALGESGQIDAAIAACESLVADCSRIRGPHDPVTRTTRRNLARWLGEAGRHDKSGRLEEAIAAYEEMLEELLSGQDAMLHASDPDVLSIQHNLALLLGEAGRTSDAIVALEALLPRMAANLGADYGNTLGVGVNLAVLLGRDGRVQDAIDITRKTLLPEMERSLGADHPNTLSARHNLAHWLGVIGSHGEAIAVCEELLPARQRVLGDEHPKTLITRQTLAVQLARASRRREAMTALEELIPDLERVFGANHRLTLLTRSQRSSLIGNAGGYGDAITEYRRLLPELENVVGSDDRDTLDAQNDLAVCLLMVDETKEALKTSRAVLKVRLRKLGADDAATLLSRQTLIACLRKAGRIDEAITNCRTLLKSQERTLGSDDPETLRTKKWIATLKEHRKQGGTSGRTR